MAYDDQFGDVLNAPSTFMLGDVLSLMSLYGVNQTANSGNSTYSFYDDSLRETIWDAAGIDTLDLSAMNDPVKVYLTYLYSDADLGMEYGHIIVNPDTADAKWTHLLGEFESIYCGSGADKIFGDENNNFIHGGAGNDLISGSVGNDIIYGGEGNDTFILGFGDGQDIVKDFDFGNDQCIFWNGSEYDPTIASLSEDINGFAAYILDDGTSISLEGVSYSQMESVDTLIA
jgi:Ca2+-binding RTX toxin-like protein